MRLPVSYLSFYFFNSTNPYFSVWIEVHCGNKWLPILMQEKEFGIVEHAEVEGLMKQPMSYAVAFDSGVRDVTARYAKDWLTSTKKLRFGVFKDQSTSYCRSCYIIMICRFNSLVKPLED